MTKDDSVTLALEWEGMDGGALVGAARIVDDALERFNRAAADFSKSTRFAFVARLTSGTVVGGAIARWWGECCELQQLWVDERCRGAGLGSSLVRRVEDHGRIRGCSLLYLETFSFQAPRFYSKLGYEVACELQGFPNNVSKFVLRKTLAVS